MLNLSISERTKDVNSPLDLALLVVSNITPTVSAKVLLEDALILDVVVVSALLIV